MTQKSANVFGMRINMAMSNNIWSSQNNGYITQLEKTMIAALCWNVWRERKRQ